MNILDLIDQMGFVAIPFIILALLILAVSFSKDKKKLQDSLASGKKGMAHGIIFGKEKGNLIYSPTDQEGHIAVFGGSGLGKTSAILIPTLKSWEGTSFSIDISGDIEANVSMKNKVVYDPDDPQSTPYDVFGAIDLLPSDTEKNEALEELAFLIMPDRLSMSDASRFFNTEGRKILTASLIAFYHTGLDFCEICQKIFENSWKHLFAEIDQTNVTKAISYINSFLGASEQNTAGCKQAVDAVIKLFATNAAIQNSVHRPQNNKLTYSPAILETHNVFIKISDSKLKLYEPLLHMITAQTLQYFSARQITKNSKTILICLDELASLGKLELIDALRKYRKKKIRIMTLTQSMADVDMIYGHDERMAMLNNYRFKVLLGADDTDTQEYFAKLLGHQITNRGSVAKNAKQTTKTKTETLDWIIPPESLAHLGDQLLLLHPEGYKKLQKAYYYK